MSRIAVRLSVVCARCRYDTVPEHAAGVKKAPSVEEILAPVYASGRGPPSYESKESYDKGPMTTL
jgi:hypothetical protein